MVRIEINQEAVRCTCGFYDKSFKPIRMARAHNSKTHGGNLPIFDIEHDYEISQFTGEPLANQPKDF